MNLQFIHIVYFERVRRVIDRHWRESTGYVTKVPNLPRPRQLCPIATLLPNTFFLIRFRVPGVEFVFPCFFNYFGRFQFGIICTYITHNFHTIVWLFLKQLFFYKEYEFEYSSWCRYVHIISLQYGWRFSINKPNLTDKLC